MSDSFVYSIRSVIFFWGAILLISDHILKKLHKPMKEQLKKKETILLLIIHLTYLIAVLLYLSEDLEVFIYPILFYAATLAGRRFLSIVLWREQQSNKNLFLMIGTVLLVFSGSIYIIKLFTGTLSITQNFIRVTLFTCSVFLICLHFIVSKKVNENLKYFSENIYNNLLVEFVPLHLQFSFWISFIPINHYSASDSFPCTRN